jgi:hypothetical protein
MSIGMEANQARIQVHPARVASAAREEVKSGPSSKGGKNDMKHGYGHGQSSKGSIHQRRASPREANPAHRARRKEEAAWAWVWAGQPGRVNLAMEWATAGKKKSIRTIR